MGLEGEIRAQSVGNGGATHQKKLQGTWPWWSAQGQQEYQHGEDHHTLSVWWQVAAQHSTQGASWGLGHPWPFRPSDSDSPLSACPENPRSAGPRGGAAVHSEGLLRSQLVCARVPSPNRTQHGGGMGCQGHKDLAIRWDGSGSPDCQVQEWLLW